MITKKQDIDLFFFVHANVYSLGVIRINFTLQINDMSGVRLEKKFIVFSRYDHNGIFVKRIREESMS